jgi:glyoxylase-like metal-dependent hydrolase (beta-lactamase superfamily II)
MTSRFTQISPDAWVVQSSLYHTNSGIFLTGRDAVLIDPGVTPAELDALAAFLTARGTIVRTIVLTHAHWDHLLGPVRFPKATVMAHARYLDVVEVHRADLRRQVRSGLDEADERASFPPAPDVTFHDCLSLTFDALRLEVRFAPGHAPDHSVVYEPGNGVLWAGDMLSDLEVPMPMDTFADYLRTLDALSDRRIDVLVPGHGTPTRDPEEVNRRLDQDRAYLRVMVRCVRAALASGADLASTLDACECVPFAQPDTYPNAHRWNIEQAYLELGGEPLRDSPVGWAQDWL